MGEGPHILEESTVFSLQSILGGRGRTIALLQASSEAVLEAAQAARQLAIDSDSAAAMAVVVTARRREKELAAEISQELVNTFVTVLDREDVEAMNDALYRIPKTIEKFAERYALIAERLDGMDLSERAEILVGCAEIVVRMVKELHNGLRIGALREMHRQLRALESEADELLLDPYRDLYVNTTDPMRAVLAKDLFETLEQAIDKCRDVGNIVYSIALKNS